MLGGNGTASDSSGLSEGGGHGGDVHREEAKGVTRVEDNRCVGEIRGEDL